MSSAAANAGGNGAPAPGANLSNREITRRYFAYSAMFWTGPTRWIAWGYTLALLAVALSLVVAMVGINRWMAIFFDAVERKDAAAIISRLSVIAALGAVSAALYGMWTFLGERMKVSWRERLTIELIDKWLHSDHCRHHERTLTNEINSPEFRIAEDVRMSIEPLVDFSTTLINALGSAVAFIVVLWSVGGSFAVVDGLILARLYGMARHRLFAAVLVGHPHARSSDRAADRTQECLRGAVARRYGPLP